MGQVREVTLDSSGGDVTVEVAIQYPQPAAISVALYDGSRQKERDIGSALSMEPPDPDVFAIEPQGQIANLSNKIIGVFVAISSFTPQEEEPVIVVSVLRQGAAPVTNGVVVEHGTVKQGGAGVIIGYKTSVQ